MTQCSSCGKDVPAGAKFCGICGHPMGQQSPPSPSSPSSRSAAPSAASAAEDPPSGSTDPIPGIPGQTNFFKAAAGVDRGSQIRRTIRGIVLLVGLLLGLFLLLSVILPGHR